MKHKYIFIIVIALCFFADVQSAPISEGEARTKALGFMRENLGMAESAGAKGIGNITETTLTTAEACDAYYVFNNESDGGYIIVSGDDRMPTVLGYSRNGRYDINDMPENMRVWMQGYAKQYDYLQNKGSAVAVTTNSVLGEKILPLLSCQWNQSYPFNMQCPKIKGKRTLTGCVATAMAQIMYYWKWPKKTVKEIPAYDDVLAIGVTTINWEDIFPVYSSNATSEQAEAISKLLKICGASVKMTYGLEASGASTENAMKAFYEYFDYNSLLIKKVYRAKYSAELWNQMIYDELREGRPVLYDGQSSHGGHAFVIDGYDGDDYFHVNWGWGGYEDDYFLLNALNGYDSDQSAIIGIQGKSAGDDRRFYISLENGVLTFHYDNKREECTGELYSNVPTWYGDQYLNRAEEIKTVVFNPSVADCHYINNASYMFYNMKNLSSIQGLQYFDTHNVTDMRNMFYNCMSLSSLDVSNFNTQNVTDMSYMFSGCSLLNSLDVSGFNTQNVTDMCSMFFGCSLLNSLDVSGFNTQNVTDMRNMFYNCMSLSSLDVSGFNTQNVTSMGSMFSNCMSLSSLDVSGFNTQNVTSMSSMFYKCMSLSSLDVSNFNTQNVTDMRSMFYNCMSLSSLDISNFNTQNVTDMNYMFSGCSLLKSLDVSGFNTQNVTDMNYMFSGCSLLNSLDVSGFNTQNVTDMRNMFYNCESLLSLDVSGFNTQNVTDMNYMFSNCMSLSSLDVSDFNTQNVTSMSSMFSNCMSLSSLDVSNFNTQNVMSMVTMFYNCMSLSSLDVSNFNTQNVTDMSYMFSGCSLLKSLDVSGFNTQNVTSMGSMFSNCMSLSSLDVSNFDTQNVTYMSYMFSGCSLLKSLDVSNFNTQNVTSMVSMFSGCSLLKSLDISGFNTQNVTSMSSMFYQCRLLTRIYAGEQWNLGKVENSSYVFYNCNMIVGNDGTKYDNRATDATKAHYGEGGYLTFKPATILGDINGDGSITMADANMIVNAFLGGQNLELKKADVNGDGQITMADANQVVNMFLDNK